MGMSSMKRHINNTAAESVIVITCSVSWTFMEASSEFLGLYCASSGIECLFHDEDKFRFVFPYKMSVLHIPIA